MTPLEIHQLADEIWAKAKPIELVEREIADILKRAASKLHEIASDMDRCCFTHTCRHGVDGRCCFQIRPCPHGRP